MIGVEVDFHFVRFGRYDRQIEVQRSIWISIREAAAVVYQGRSIPIGDLDKVVFLAGGWRSTNSKVVELKPQYLPTLHSDLFSFVKAVRIVSRVVG